MQFDRLQTLPTQTIELPNGQAQPSLALGQWFLAPADGTALSGFNDLREGGRYAIFPHPTEGLGVLHGATLRLPSERDIEIRPDGSALEFIVRNGVPEIIGGIGGGTVGLSPVDFGAAGDGVADDTAALQAWSDELTNNGGHGVVPTGTYLITDTIDLRADNFDLSIEAAATARFKFVFAEGGAGVQQRGINIRSSRAGSRLVYGGGYYDLSGIPQSGTGESNDGIYINSRNLDQVVLRDMYLRNGYTTFGDDGGADSAIFVAEASNLHMEGIHIDGAADAGIYVSASQSRAGSKLHASGISGSHIFNEVIVAKRGFSMAYIQASGTDCGSVVGLSTAETDTEFASARTVIVDAVGRRCDRVLSSQLSNNVIGRVVAQDLGLSAGFKPAATAPAAAFLGGAEFNHLDIVANGINPAASITDARAVRLFHNTTVTPARETKNNKLDILAVNIDKWGLEGQGADQNEIKLRRAGSTGIVIPGELVGDHSFIEESFFSSGIYKYTWTKNGLIDTLKSSGNRGNVSNPARLLDYDIGDGSVTLPQVGGTLSRFTSTSAGGSVVAQLAAPAAALLALGSPDNAAEAAIRTNHGTDGGTSAGGGTLEILRRNIVKLRMKTDGSVGLGDNLNPTCRLQVAGPIRPASYTLETLPDAAAVGAGAMAYATNGSPASIMVSLAGSTWRNLANGTDYTQT